MTLIAIGGAEDKTGDMTVLKRVVAESGIENPRVLVITTATSYPVEVAEKYKTAFAQLGVTAEALHITQRRQAKDKAMAAKLDAADIIFFSGGDQTKIAYALNDTPFLAALKRREQEGAVIAGTSAGAAAMSHLMIAGGNPAKPADKGGLKTRTGLGLMPDVVFDTHFMNRGRLPRLFNAVAADSTKTGIGLDEDTGVIIRQGQDIEVVGSGAVTVVDKDGARSYKSGDRFKP